MKKLFFIVLTIMMSTQLMVAQNSRADAKPAQPTKPKPVPVKMVAKPVPVSNEKASTTAPAQKNAPNKEATTNTKPNNQAKPASSTSAKPVMKKDGTPDKRYKENQTLKKDGTPDKRYKENKSTGSKK